MTIWKYFYIILSYNKSVLKSKGKSKSEIYYIMIRGINREVTFQDEEDSQVFLKTIGIYKDEIGIKIYAYFLMKNHIHLLIKADNEKIGTFMRKLGSKYVYWYNRKYNRIGGLFQDRYKSEPVENDKYLLTVIRYIHQNPLKAGICNKIEEYKKAVIMNI